LCFVGKRKFRPFLAEYIPKNPGKFINIEDGSELAKHEGTSFYTIGQRAMIGGKSSKYYIAKKEVSTNTLFVCAGHEHPMLYYDQLTANVFHWIAGSPPRELVLA